MTHNYLIKQLLVRIGLSDPSCDGTDLFPNAAERYAERNRLVLELLGAAMALGMNAGVAFDPNTPTWPVVYVDLPTGQVSWHVAPYVGKYDGHTTALKYDRCRAY